MKSEFVEIEGIAGSWLDDESAFGCWVLFLLFVEWKSILEGSIVSKLALETFDILGVVVFSIGIEGGSIGRVVCSRISFSESVDDADDDSVMVEEKR